MIPKKDTAKDLWKPKRRIELLYQRNLRRIMKTLQKELKKANDLSEIVKILKKFTQSKEFKEYAEASALKMVTGVFTDAGKTWRTAANVNSKGRQIYEALQKEFETPIGLAVKEQIERNSQLIKSMPEKIRSEITDIIARESREGRRASEIAEDLQERFPEMLKAKADLIARTETSKTESALNQARSQSIGLNWYIWRTSDDSRVRKSHDHMEDVLVNWNNPPSPEALIRQKSKLGNYHAGCAPNCRCYSEIVIRLDFIKWPHKVYYNNKITYMSRKQFEQISLIAS